MNKHLNNLVLLIIAFAYQNSSLAQDEDKKVGGKEAVYILPSITLQNPINPGKLGLVVVSAAIQNKTRIGNQTDANAGIYIGLGNPEKFIGIGAALNIYGLSNSYGEKENIGEGSVGFHVNKYLSSQLMIDAGIDNAIVWGGSPVFRDYITYDRSFYFSTNYTFILRKDKLPQPFNYVSITAGVGNGYFKGDESYSKNKNSFDPFISIATPVLKSTNVIMEWNGYDIALGLSSIPLRKFPLMVTLELTDVLFGSPRIVSSASLPLNFGKRGKPVNIRSVRIARTI